MLRSGWHSMKVPCSAGRRRVSGRSGCSSHLIQKKPQPGQLWCFAMPLRWSSHRTSSCTELAGRIISCFSTAPWQRLSWPSTLSVAMHFLSASGAVGSRGLLRLRLRSRSRVDVEDTRVRSFPSATWARAGAGGSSAAAASGSEQSDGDQDEKRSTARSPGRSGVRAGASPLAFILLFRFLEGRSHAASLFIFFFNFFFRPDSDELWGRTRRRRETTAFI
ncbi:hypothetical protein EYF80_030056 [Liparis tanakae]|uniref:Uncharacterized protein n=1 Tax=Liparis tanakae TaxID=230148 RepID=A0A4Z2H2Z9_9TELE|nr:hypothetical protein EYF80_030056 [Liparis tanakae]